LKNKSNVKIVVQLQNRLNHSSGYTAVVVVGIDCKIENGVLKRAESKISYNKY